MFFSILKWVLISLTLIFLMHHLYMFLMNTLTVPKIKDLVNKPTQQYHELYNTIGGSTASLAHTLPNENGTQGGLHLNPEGGQGAVPPLTDELSSFLSDLKKKSANAVGPNAVGPNAVGPNALGTGSLGPTDKFPSTLGSLGGEMGYSLY